MSENRVYAYEGMFLLGQAQAADLSGAIQHIQEIMARGHAEILAMRKWDERRLAYEIRGQKRGTYILLYFKAPGKDVAHIERDCNLSERVLRTLILRADHMTEEQMRSADARKELEIEAKLRAERPAAVAPAPVAAAVEADDAEV
jgi:small subunit ribosomal protein S6